MQHVIAAVRNNDDLDKALASGVRMVFLLSGDLRTLCGQCDRLRQAGRLVILHMDLVEGLKGDESGISYAATEFQLAGVISTKVTCLKLAHEAGLLAILRVFAIDSSALKTGVSHARLCYPDFVEVLPGVSPKIIRLACGLFDVPVIAGGLIDCQRDVTDALKAGAAAVSTSHSDLWNQP